MVPLPFLHGKCVARYNIRVVGLKGKQNNFFSIIKIILLRGVHRMRLCNVVEDDPNDIFICLGVEGWEGSISVSSLARRRGLLLLIFYEKSALHGTTGGTEAKGRKRKVFRLFILLS